MNQEYEDVAKMLLNDLKKQFVVAYEAPEDNKPRMRALLLFMTELFVCGFAFPFREISELLKKLVKVGTKKKNNFTTEKELRLFAYYYNCDMYASFLINYGPIFTLEVSKWIREWT